MKEAELRTIIDKVTEQEKDDSHIVEYLMDFGSVQVCVKTSTN